MTKNPVSRNWPTRIRSLALRGLLASLLAIPVFMAFASVPAAQAAGSGTRIVADPPGPGSGSSSGSSDTTLDDFETRLLDLGKTVIKLLMFIGAILLAIAIPKEAVMAQASNLFGNAIGMSHAWMNVLAAIVAGGVLFMSMPLVDLIFKLFVPTGSVNVHIPVPGF
jgi:hypothetical protein